MTTAVAPAAGLGRRWTRLLARWETLLVVALVGLIALGTSLSPFFLTPGNFSNLIAALMEVAIMALPMTLIIVAGEIDLSVESMAGLASAILGFLWAAGVPLWDRDPGRPRRRSPGRPDERPARGPRRPAVARRDPWNAGPLPRPGPDRAGPARRQRLPAAFTELGFGHVPGR